jgi:acyl-CoA reductase-like NAD-dependent aldehyde dehydrogenase
MASHGELKESRNPATYKVIGHYHDGGREQAEAAIAAATRAFTQGDWARNIVLRADALAELADRFDAHLQSFIDIYKLETESRRRGRKSRGLRRPCAIGARWRARSKARAAIPVPTRFP